MGSGAITGSVELTQKLLSSIMPEDKVDSLMEEIRGPAGRTAGTAGGRTWGAHRHRHGDDGR